MATRFEIKGNDIVLNAADGPNSEVRYSYRDGYNYKIAARVIFAGHISEEQVRAMFAALNDGEWNPDADHPWHELGSICYTSLAPTDERPIAELVAAFTSAVWDGEYKPPFYNEMKRRYDARVEREAAEEEE